MQDNLEFLQWMKKYWDSNSRGEEYNAVERAGGHSGHAAAARAAPTPPSRGPTARVASGRPSLAGAGAARSASAASNAQIQHLNAQVNELQSTCEGLEKERDFYFASES